MDTDAMENILQVVTTKCAYCERKRVLRDSGDDLINFCPTCIDGQYTKIHVRCIERLERPKRFVAALHCTNPNCPQLFREYVNETIFENAHTRRNRLAYYISIPFWIASVIFAATFAVIFSECNERTLDWCMPISSSVFGLSVCFTFFAFISRMNEAIFYYKLCGSFHKATLRIVMEQIGSCVCMGVGFFVVLSIPRAYELGEVALATSLFVYGAILIPALIWSSLRNYSKMKLDVEKLRYSLNLISVRGFDGKSFQSMEGDSGQSFLFRNTNTLIKHE